MLAFLNIIDALFTEIRFGWFTFQQKNLLALENYISLKNTYKLEYTLQLTLRSRKQDNIQMAYVCYTIVFTKQ